MATVKPGTFITPLKTSKGYRGEEVFSLRVIKALPEADRFVEKKIDGFRILVSRDGDKVRIQTDQKNDVTKQLPTIVKEALQLKSDSFIIDAEAVYYDKYPSSPRRREAAVRIISTKAIEPEEANIHLLVFDAIYHDGKALNNLPLRERKKHLKEIGQTKHIHNLNSILTSNTKALIAAVKKTSNENGSEGSMLKEADSIYSLAGVTSKWIKFKNSVDVDAIVYKKEVVKGGKAWNYVGLVGPVPKGDKDVYLAVTEYKGKLWIKIGKTYNSKISLDVGDIMRVSVVRILKAKVADKFRYTWSNPLVIEKEPETRRPSSLPDLDRLAKQFAPVEAGRYLSKTQIKMKRALLTMDGISFRIDRLLEKSQTLKRIEELKKPTQLQEPPKKFVKVPADDEEPSSKKGGFMSFTDWEKAKKPKLPFVLQMHYRGATVHGDLRLAQHNSEGLTHLEGWTVLCQTAGISGPVLTVEEAKKVPKKYYKDKIDNNPNGKKIRVERKVSQPLEWLKVEGVTEKGDVGATKNFPGVFWRTEHGTYIPGTQENDFHEIFLVPDKKSDEILMSGRWFIREIPDSQNPGKKFWIAFKAKDQKEFPSKEAAVKEGGKKVKSSREECDEQLIELGLLDPERNIKQKNDSIKQEIIESLLDEILSLRDSKNKKELLHIQNDSPNVKIEAELKAKDGSSPLIIQGIAIREGIWNGCYYSAAELKKAYQTLKNKPVRLDHSRAVRDTVGKVINVYWDEENRQIIFRAIVHNKEVISLIKKNMVDSVSVGVYIDNIYTEMGETAINLQFHELSIVTDPAVNVAKFVVKG